MSALTKTAMSYKTKAIFVIVTFTIIRLLLAFTMSLGIDESYYWTYSQQLKWNYFDHPPMVAVFIRLSTLNLLLENIEGFVRLGAVLGCAISSWFIYKTCTLLHSQKAGFYGALLYNVSFYTAITSGLFIMPDGPQMVFYTWSIWLVATIVTDEQNWLNWLLFGVAAGLCIMSKVHGIFIWVGLGLFIVLRKRAWLKFPQLYAALFISVIIALPILIWNIQNDFVAYNFHSKRVVVNNSTLNPISFTGEIISQLLYNNVFNVLPGLMALVAFYKTKPLQNDALRIYNFIGLPLAIILLVVALFRDTTLPHWSGPAYVALIPLTAIYIASHSTKISSFFTKLAVVSFLLVMILGKIALHFYPGSFGADVEGNISEKPSTQNNLLKVFDGFAKMQLVAEPTTGWSDVVNQFDSLYTSETNRTTRQETPIVYNDWRGAQIDYYFCRNGKVMIGLGELQDLHEYAWSNKLYSQQVDLNRAYYILSSDDYNRRNNFSAYYSAIDSITTLSAHRGRRPDLKFHVYRLSGWKGRLPLTD